MFARPVVDPGRVGGHAMVTAKLYVEGGGDSKSLHIACRRGFSEFLRKSGLAGHMPRIVACGGRRQAYDGFCASPGGRSEEVALLLVDSETAVTSKSPWTHLKEREGDAWDQPDGATDKQCHLMVQCMESWFLADKESLRSFFGQDFNENSLPRRADIEAVDKDSVLSSLRAATRQCRRNHSYAKGEISFTVLAAIDPAKVTAASPWAKRLVDSLRELL